LLGGSGDGCDAGVLGGGGDGCDAGGGELVLAYSPPRVAWQHAWTSEGPTSMDNPMSHYIFYAG
jgi:hypothetical protein